MPRLPNVYELATFLADNPITRELSSTDIAELLFALQVVPVGAGEPLFAAGDVGDAFYLVYAGTLQLERGGQVIGRVAPGALVGEHAVIDGQPRAATARAEGPAICLRFPTATMEALLGSGSLAMHRLLVAMLRGLVRGMRPHHPDVALSDLGGWPR